jgi:predicted RNA binding protein YcfA (HicA-like mRNA interferase family)
MTKIDKLMVSIQNNPKAVRFDDLVTVMGRCGWEMKQAKGSSHVKFKKPGEAPIIGVKPHGGKTYADVALVEDCLSVLEGD